MKWIIILAIILTGASCQKEETPNKGVSAVRNGISWKGNVRVVPVDGHLDIEIWHLNDEGYRRETLGFIGIPKGPGQYELQENCETCEENRAVYNTLAGDGHILCEIYRLQEAEQTDNFLEITDYDSSTGRVSGTFELVFVLDDHRCDETAPGTVRFTDGAFQATLER